MFLYMNDYSKFELGFFSLHAKFDIYIEYSTWLLNFESEIWNQVAGFVIKTTRQEHIVGSRKSDKWMVVITQT